jgi:CRISPR-associated endoribonuclease Cas6
MFTTDLVLSSETSVPYDYKYELYSAIMARIKNRNSELSTLIHTSRGIPLLNISSLLPLKFNGSAKWPNARLFALVINTVNSDVAETISAVFEKGVTIILNSVMLSVVSMTQKTVDFKYLPTLPVLKSRAPVVIRDNGKYYRFGDTEFEYKLAYSLKRKADAATGKNTVVRGLTITSGHRKIYVINGHAVPASIISFIIDADEDVVRTALVYGVGSKTQMGFGMVGVG